MYYSFRAVIDGQTVKLIEPNTVEGHFEAIVTVLGNASQPAAPPRSAPVAYQPASSLALNKPAPSSWMPPLLRKQPSLAPSSDISASAAAASAPAAPIWEARPLSTTAKVLLPPVPPAAENGDTALYHEKARRERQGADCVFVDVTNESYQRSLQGDASPLVFEPKGNRFSATFVLMDETSLYLNFYTHNEDHPVTADRERLLSKVYDIKGSLPDLVKVCIPARVSACGGGYVIVKKGVLLLEGGA